MTAENNTWDHSVDVLVVGSGNGGMTAALCCYEMGLSDVLMVEKGSKYGGTSSLSGGGVWIPNNRYAKAAGAQDSFADAQEYLKHTLPEGVVAQDMVDTYLREGPKMIDFLHQRTRVRYQSLDHYPDYYSAYPGSRPGHRSMEPEPINKSELGEDADELEETHHMMFMFDRIGITQVEAQILTGQMKGWIGITLRLLLNYALDIPWRLREKRARRLTCGSAGVCRLRLSMKDRNIPLWLNAPMQELICDEQGRVCGAVVRKDGQLLRIEARKGVILAAGGFEHNQAMREQYLPKPTRASWSAAIETNTGDAINAGIAQGAATAQMNGAWWCTTFSTPGEPRPRLAIMEKSFPGNVVVNQKGKRISNESQNYMAYQLELFAKHSDENPCVPAYMVFDSRFRENYIVGPLMTKSMRPDRSLPKSYFESGFLAKADSIEELARMVNIDVDGLQTTISNMNQYAVTGKDLELHRGDSEYDRYYGDPKVKPNPCLAPIDKPPYYAILIDPGDFGTQGGLVTDPNAQVLKQDGTPIAGLYATGNCSAAVLPTYPGPGSTLGPAMTFAWQAAKHLTGYEA